MKNAVNKIIEIEHSSEMIIFTNEEIETIRRTVAIDANEDEFKMFMHLAKTYGLDPFNKEIFFWKIKGNPTIMTSRDGYLKIADRYPEYDGLVSDVVREKDKYTRTVEGVTHQYGTDRGDIIGAYALVYRKDRRYPVYVFAPFKEYYACNRVWSQYPSAMILKVAESMALKRSFTVSGLVSSEELDVARLREKDDLETNKLDVNVTHKSNNKPIDITADLSKREKEIKNIIGGDSELRKDLFSYLEYVKSEKGLEDGEKLSLDDLTDEQFEELENLLNSFKGFSDLDQDNLAVS